MSAVVYAVLVLPVIMTMFSSCKLLDKDSETLCVRYVAYEFSNRTSIINHKVTIPFTESRMHHT